MRAQIFELKQKEAEDFKIFVFFPTKVSQKLMQHLIDASQSKDENSKSL